MTKRASFSTFIDNYGVCVIYLIAFLFLVFSAIWEKHWLMLFPTGIFILYDVWFRWLRPNNTDWVLCGRDYKETVESIRAASQYTSFFIAFIAVSLTIMLDNEVSEKLLKLFDNGFIEAYGLIVLSLSSVILLFIPIPYLAAGKVNSKEPSTALKNCFFSVLLMEKIIILLLVYLIILIAKKEFLLT